jgi:ankyrin repeat protein
MHFKKTVWLLSFILILGPALFVSAGDETIDDAFIAAVGENNIDKVNQLLDKGANIEFADMMGTPALILAASEKHIDMVKLLIGRGCHVNAVDNLGSTALHMGIRSYEVTKILLTAGADPWRLNKRGETALDFAVSEYTDKNETVELFLERKPDQKLLDKALASAAKGGNPKKLNLLIKAGANINPPDGKESPLISACQEGSWSTARELLRNGARIDHIDARERTALYHAVKRADEGMVRLLLQHGADPRIWPKGSPSLLVASLDNENYEISRLLVAACATMDHDVIGKPAIEDLRSRGLEALAKLMEQGCSKRLKQDMMIDTPIEKGDQEKINQLLAGKWQLVESETELDLNKNGKFRWSIEGFLSKEVLEGSWKLKNGDLNLQITKSSDNEKPSARQLGIVKISDEDLVFGGIMDYIRYKRIK